MAELLAPNGKPSNLSPEQYKLVRSQSFKAWFGDWENLILTKINDSGIDEISLKRLEDGVSKIIDNNGEPLPVYHGTSAEPFVVFDGGSFFTDDYMNADGYASGEMVYEVFLNIKKPLIINAEGRKWDNLENEYGSSTRDIVGQLDFEKYDGVIFNNINDNWFDDEMGDTQNVYFSINPEQIKLADGTNTTFDGNNPDIRFDGGGIVSNYKEFYDNLQIEDGSKYIGQKFADLFPFIGKKTSPAQFRISVKEYNNLLGRLENDNYTTKGMKTADFNRLEKRQKYIDKKKYLSRFYLDPSGTIIGFDNSDNTYADGGSVIINPTEIECHTCHWKWKVKDGGDDLFICHKCYTDNTKFYKFEGLEGEKILDTISYKKGGKIDDKVGKEFWFEYHCFESDESCDSEIWYRSHQKVKVLSVSEWSFDELKVRIEDGQPRVYSVKFNDGFIADVLEDELMESKDEFYRPDPPKTMKKGGRTISQTPAPKKDQIKGSDKNKEGSSKDLKSAKEIELSDKTIESIKNKVDKHNEKHTNKRINIESAKAVVRRGMGAYSSSYRPIISGGKPNSRVAWGLARLNAFLYKIVNGKSKSGKYSQDNDLIEELGYKVQKYADGGEIINIMRNEIIDILSKNSRYGKQILSVQEVGVEVIQSCIESNTYFGNSIKQANENYIMIPVSYEDKLWAIDKKVGYIYFAKPNENTKIRVEYKYDMQDYPVPVLFDSEIMNNEKFYDVNDYEEINVREFDSEFLYRGINNNEMLSIIENGFIKSNASMNIGKQQEETTSFAQHISQASAYAVGFNAWYDEVTFAKPKYILKVKKEGVKYKPTIETDIQNEVDVFGEIPIQQIESIYEFRLGECQMGQVEINVGYNNDFSEGSRSPMFKKVFVRKTDVNTLINETNSKNKNKNNDMTNSNPKDTITMDVPLLIRFAELMREDIKTDVDLHRVVENLLQIKDKGTLTMDDYESIVGNFTGTEEKMADGGVIINESIAGNQLSKPVVGMVLIPKDASTFDSVYYVYSVGDEAVRIGVNEGNTTGISISDLNRKFRPATQDDINMSESLTDTLFAEGGKVNSIKSKKGDIKLSLGENWYSDDTKVELVPVSELIKFREFDRKVSPKYNQDNSRDNINHLKFMFQKNGVQEPIIIEYSAEDKSVLVIEGNHRINSAIDLGMEYLPARVVLKKYGHFSPKQSKSTMKVNGVTADESGYISSDLKPSQVGIQGTMPIYADGGIIEGRLHSECGDDGCGRKFQVGENGHIIEAERDEAVIVADAFESNEELTIKGTPSEVASALNVIGGGKNFDKGATIIKNGQELEIPELKKQAIDTDVDDIIEPSSIIINRRSMADEKEYEVTGTPKQIASAINSLNGNGVVIEKGAEIKQN